MFDRISIPARQSLCHQIRIYNEILEKLGGHYRELAFAPFDTRQLLIKTTNGQYNSGSYSLADHNLFISLVPLFVKPSLLVN